MAIGGGSVSNERGKLNDHCTNNGDCNPGLVCSATNGTTGVCKVAHGGVCSVTTECAADLTCQNGVCLTKAGELNDPCPCGEGYTCVNGICKVKIGGTCSHTSDCADSICCAGVCTLVSNCNNKCNDSSCDCHLSSSSSSDCKIKYSSDSYSSSDKSGSSSKSNSSKSKSKSSSSKSDSIKPCYSSSYSSYDRSKSRHNRKKNKQSTYTLSSESSDCK